MLKLKSCDYILKNMDPDLWFMTKELAARNHQTCKSLILTLLSEAISKTNIGQIN